MLPRCRTGRGRGVTVTETTAGTLVPFHETVTVVTGTRSRGVALRPAAGPGLDRAQVRTRTLDLVRTDICNLASGIPEAIVGGRGAGGPGARLPSWRPLVRKLPLRLVSGRGRPWSGRSGTRSDLLIHRRALTARRRLTAAARLLLGGRSGRRGAAPG